MIRSSGCTFFLFIVATAPINISLTSTGNLAEAFGYGVSVSDDFLCKGALKQQIRCQKSGQGNNVKSCLEADSCRWHPKSIGTALKMSQSEGRQDGLPEKTFGTEGVPEDQVPGNEYLNLIRQPLFDWADQNSGDKGLAIRLGVTYMAFFGLVCYPIAGATYVQEGYFWQKLAAANVGAVIVVLGLLLRLYSGWGFVGSRLQSKVVEFEETGWYDGNVEKKTEAERARDLFLYRSNVLPVVERLKVACIAAGAAFVLSCVGLNVADRAKPLFDQYDTELLKALPYDDKLAGKVAEQSGGRPTYCNSRYYRAVANGGQGCN